MTALEYHILLLAVLAATVLLALAISTAIVRAHPRTAARPRPSTRDRAAPPPACGPHDNPGRVDDNHGREVRR